MNRNLDWAAVDVIPPQNKCGLFPAGWHHWAKTKSGQLTLQAVNGLSLLKAYAVLPARNLGLAVFFLPVPPNLLLLRSPSVEAGDSVVLRSRFLPEAPPLKPELPPRLEDAEELLGLAVDRATFGSSVTATAAERGLGVTVVDMAPSGGGCLMKLGSVGRGLAAK